MSATTLQNVVDELFSEFPDPSVEPHVPCRCVCHRDADSNQEVSLACQLVGRAVQRP